MTADSLPAPKRKMPLWNKVVLVIGAIIVYGALAPHSPPAGYQSLDKSAATQAKREQFISKMKRLGVLHKIEVPASHAHAYMLPRFYTLTVDEKRSFVSVIYAYHLARDPKAQIVNLYDARNGKRIGSFSDLGLSLK